LRQQLGMIAAFDDVAGVEDEDFVGGADRREAMAITSDVRPASSLWSACLDQQLGLRVDVRGPPRPESAPRVGQDGARAIAMSWRWPSDRFAARSSTTVS